MDRFALTSHSVSSPTDPKGLRALGQYDQTDLPYYYELATAVRHQRFFPLVAAGNTVPNRQYMFCATSQEGFSHHPRDRHPWTCPTIFSSLQNAGVRWSYYDKDGIFLAGFPRLEQSGDPAKDRSNPKLF